ncbi:MAG: glycosyltransferase [Myxococcota bacterium]|nr:glycosyltransferase [Myxococcota bacterium]
MNRVLLVGRGPLPTPDQTTGGFAQLRTRHFLKALTAAGYDVRLLLLHPTGSPPALPGGDDWSGVFIVEEEGPGWLDQCAVHGRDADVVVSAGPYAPGRAAVAAAGDAPLWVDVPGDPYAELEAVSRASPVPLSPARTAAAHAAFAPVLARADALSTVSAPQRLALLGQLGVAGRLHPRPPVHPVPIAFDLPLPRRTPRARDASTPLTVALAGSANPWMDISGLVDAFRAVQDRRPDTRFIVTGGPVAGLPAPDWSLLSAWAGEHADTVSMLGWIPHGDLPTVLGAAHVGVFADRPAGLEPELGDRTRALLYAWLGLDIVATDRSERMRDLHASGVATAVPAGRPDALAAALLALANRDRDVDRSRSLSAHLEAHSAPAELAAPLLSWVAAPRRVEAVESPSAILSAERDRLLQELHTMHASPTWRLLARLHQRVKGSS